MFQSFGGQGTILSRDSDCSEELFLSFKYPMNIFSGPDDGTGFGEGGVAEKRCRCHTTPLPVDRPEFPIFRFTNPEAVWSISHLFIDARQD